MSGRIATAQWDGLSLTLPDVKGLLWRLKPRRPSPWAMAYVAVAAMNVVEFATDDDPANLVVAIGCACCAKAEWRAGPAAARQQPLRLAGFGLIMLGVIAGRGS